MSNVLYSSMPYVPVDALGNMLVECDVTLDDSENRYLFIARSVTKRRVDGTTVSFEPLSSIAMRLALEEFDETLNVFWWYQVSTNKRFAMSPSEFNHMLLSGRSDDPNFMLSQGSGPFIVDGTWSAVRNGNKYSLHLDGI